jgi:hypothetical protein
MNGFIPFHSLVVWPTRPLGAHTNVTPLPSTKRIEAGNLPVTLPEGQTEATLSIFQRPENSGYCTLNTEHIAQIADLRVIPPVRLTHLNRAVKRSCVISAERSEGTFPERKLLP